MRALRFGVVYWWSIGSRLDNARTHSNHQNDDDRLEREANRENTADVFKYSFHLSFSVMIICHCIHLNPCFFCWQVEVDKCRSNIKVHESFFEHCQLLDLGRQVNNDIGANKSLLTPNIGVNGVGPRSVSISHYLHQNMLPIRPTFFVCLMSCYGDVIVI